MNHSGVTHRYALQDLFDAMEMTHREGGDKLGINGTVRRRFLDEGLTEQQADKYAVRAGFHPWLIWPDMGLRAMAEVEAADFVPERPWECPTTGLLYDAPRVAA